MQYIQFMQCRRRGHGPGTSPEPLRLKVSFQKRRKHRDGNERRKEETGAGVRSKDAVLVGQDCSFLADQMRTKEIVNRVEAVKTCQRRVKENVSNKTIAIMGTELPHLSIQLPLEPPNIPFPCVVLFSAHFLFSALLSTPPSRSFKAGLSPALSAIVASSGLTSRCVGIQKTRTSIDRLRCVAHVLLTLRCHLPPLLLGFTISFVRALSARKEQSCPRTTSSCSCCSSCCHSHHGVSFSFGTKL